MHRILGHPCFTPAEIFDYLLSNKVKFFFVIVVRREKSLAFSYSMQNRVPVVEAQDGGLAFQLLTNSVAVVAHKPS